MVMVVFAFSTLFLSAIAYLFCRWKFPPGGRPYPPVLCYHKVSRHFCLEGTWTTPELFFAHIDHLLDRGFRFVSEEEFLAALAGRAPLAPGSLLLTFDDGYRELLTLVAPGLERRGIPFLVFLVAGFAGRENRWDLVLGRRPFRHLSWPEAAEVAARGGSLGSHGLSHRDLTKLDREGVVREVAESKALIEENTGCQVRSFSYPFGRFDRQVQRELARAGYQAAFSLAGRGYRRADPFAIDRSAVYIVDRPRNVRWKVEPGPMYPVERAKGWAINRVSLLTPLLKPWENRLAGKGQS